MRNFYCKDPENIENYDEAKKNNFIGWEIHHRLETHNSDGERRLVDITRKELIALDMYYNRPADELIFLKAGEHTILHHKGKPAWNKGVPMSKATKKKLSEMNKGKWKGENNGMYGKKHSEEARKKMSEAKKGNTATKGLYWYNDGKINKRAKECPEGFVPGRVSWKK